MKKYLLSTALLTLSFLSQAQVDTKNYDELEKKAATQNLDTVAWVRTSVLSLGVNQGLLHNWPAGGELASLTMNGLFNGSLIRYQNRSVWTNNLDAAYGLFYAFSNSFVPRKTDDRIDFTSKFGHRLSKKSNFYFTTLLNAKTQFTKAYDYNVPQWDTFSISKFLSPLYITLAPGIEYRKGSQISVFYSPASARLTFVDRYYTDRFAEGMYGVANGKNMRFELGSYLTARYVKEFNANISFRSRLDLYCNYLAKDAKDATGVIVKKDNPGNIDIMLDNFVAFKFFKYFSVNVGVVAIYDNDVPYNKFIEVPGSAPIAKNEPYTDLGWWQIKQFINFGFNYKF